MECSIGSSALEELARAVDRDLASPDLAPATERAYAHDWADFRRSVLGMDSSHCRPFRKPALYLKSLETARSRAPSAYGDSRWRNASISVRPVALSTLRRRLAAIAVRHTAAGHETPTDHPLVRRMLRRYRVRAGRR